MDRSRIGRRLLLALALVGAALATGCGGSGTQSSTTHGQTSTGAQTTTTTPSKPQLARETPYPYFGRVPERTHDSPDAPNPPFKFLWTFWAHQLIEFPPA